MSVTAVSRFLSSSSNSALHVIELSPLPEPGALPYANDNEDDEDKMTTQRLQKAFATKTAAAMRQNTT